MKPAVERLQAYPPFGTGLVSPTSFTPKVEAIPSTSQVLSTNPRPKPGQPSRSTS